ncbi:MAG TPA: alpha/beta hydrolase [Candidatus Acidoferrum sp.]
MAGCTQGQRTEWHRIPSSEFRFTSAGGLRVACARWDSLGPAPGVVQIAHGMSEHIGRYAGTIEALVSAGWTVYGNDHRGHGRTASYAARLGDFGEGGFDQLAADMFHLRRIAKEENPGKPFIQMEHSMGSFASQQYILDHSREVDGMILSGTLNELAQMASEAPEGKNILNAQFEPARTQLDWLTRDIAVVDAFINDPLCLAQLQPASFAAFLGAAPRLSDPARVGKIRADLPIYLFSGSEDPVGQQLEGVKLLVERYRRAGLHHISQDFYSGGRHEMLNEINRAELLNNLLGWLAGLVEKQEGESKPGKLS